MSILGGVQIIPEGFILVVGGMEQFQTWHGGSWIICVTYLQPRWTSGKRRMRWWERANPSGRVSGPLWWCWCLHRPSPRCLSSLHLWGWSDGEKRTFQLCFHPDFLSATPASHCHHGLLVQAGWTSRCCELEWQSVMDELPHADLSKTQRQSHSQQVGKYFPFFGSLEGQRMSIHERHVSMRVTLLHRQ